jgi:hypothetical protein
MVLLLLLSLMLLLLLLSVVLLVVVLLLRWKCRRCCKTPLLEPTQLLLNKSTTCWCFSFNYGLMTSA